MLLKYQSIKKLVFILPLLLFSVLLSAQSEEQEDSTAIISEMEESADSLVEPPPQNDVRVDVTEGYQDRPVVRGSIYFVNKFLQPNGGRPDSLQSRKLPDTLARQMKQDDDFWYVDYAFEKKGKKEKRKTETPTFKREETFWESDAFQTILWILIVGGFIGVMIIYLSNTNGNLFRRRSMILKSGEDENVEMDNIFEINYQREIDKAVNNGNYRLAIRLMFLKVLKNLSDRKVIDYKQDRTNFDYLTQVHSTKYYSDFFRLTLDYEYSWYGQFDIDEEKFEKIKRDFENFDRNLK